MAEIVNPKNKKAPKPDMTPMVDLGFLLITFFIYTTTFSTSSTMTFNTPSSKGTEPSPIKQSNTITLILGENNRLFWYQQDLERLSVNDLVETDYSPDGIRKAILLKKKDALELENWTVIIKPTDEANWKNTVDVLDEMAITASSRNAVVDLTDLELSVYKKKIAVVI
jgi:biopolymer transport protein ExbD